ncbi:hypothetical protein ACFVAJ_17165 [Agromyces sp. NPDC057679]|uniref:hypothetical protein n=1 Tax=Agromyces sp. NPDC057679 TaxID=3346207 RepID=UPI00366DFBBE
MIEQPPSLIQRRIRDVVQAAQGGRRVAAGALLAATIIVSGLFIVAASTSSRYPEGAGGWPAWMTFWVTFSAVAITAVRVDGRLPDWVFVIVIAGTLTTALLDIRATWGLLDHSVYLTAAPAAGAMLMVVAAQRGITAPLILASIIAAGEFAAMLIPYNHADLLATSKVGAVGITVFPLVMTVVAVQGFRSIVNNELALSQARTTARAGNELIGPEDSDEIARLDQAAESLLERVAWGTDLDPATSDRAATLATALRARLLDDRSETWLKLAVDQSEYLSRHVIVHDDEADAGLLGPDQRDGLLVGMWLLASHDRQAQGVFKIHVVVTKSGHREATVGINVSGVQIRDIDATVWDSLHRVGRITSQAGNDGFALSISTRPPAPDSSHVVDRNRRTRRNLADRAHTEKSRA